MPEEEKQRKNYNPYMHMNLDELKRVIEDNNYSGMSIKELDFKNDKFARALRQLRFGERTVLSLFCDEGLLVRLRRPSGYFANLTPEDAMRIAEKKYKGKTSTDIESDDASFALHLRRIKIGEKNLLEILADRGIIRRGNKSHLFCGPRYGRKWDGLNGGYRDWKDYAKSYTHRRIFK